MPVSDELVERVARMMFESHYATIWDNETNSLQESYRVDARSIIAALSTPELVLPLAEEMLRDARARDVVLFPGRVRIGDGENIDSGATLLDAYRAAKGE